MEDDGEPEFCVTGFQIGSDWEATFKADGKLVENFGPVVYGCPFARDVTNSLRAASPLGNDPFVLMTLRSCRLNQHRGVGGVNEPTNLRWVLEHRR